MARFQFSVMSLSLGGRSAPPARRRRRCWVDEIDAAPETDGEAEDGPGWYASSAELMRGLTVLEAPAAE